MFLVTVTHPDPSAEPAIWTPSGTAGRVSQHSPHNTWCFRLPVDETINSKMTHSSARFRLSSGRVSRSPSRPDKACVCQHHRRERGLQTGRRSPPLWWEWTDPPACLHTSEAMYWLILVGQVALNSLDPTWSHNAICLVFHLERPVVRRRFRLPRNTTRFTLLLLQPGSCSDEHIIQNYTSTLSSNI